MKALSGQQPFWWAILHAGKRIENRKQNFKYRGPILLHASKTEYPGGEAWILEHMAVDCPPFKSLPRGGFVGRARIVEVIPAWCAESLAGCVAREFSVDTNWWMRDRYGLVLADVEPLPFYPYPGALGLFNVPDDVVERVLDGLPPLEKEAAE